MKLKIGGILVFCAVFLYGCPDPPEYPIEPVIWFDDFYAEGDIGYLTVGFTDGDGDIGLTESMTESPYNIGSYYHFNMYAQYLVYNADSGKYIHHEISGTPVTFEFRVPWITPTGKNKGLKGTIRVKIEPNYVLPEHQTTDSIKYRVQLIDRALRESDWIETPPILNGVYYQ